MKLSRYVWLFWVTNLAVFAGLGVFAWYTHGNAKADRTDRYRLVEEVSTDQPRKDWQPRANTGVFDHRAMRLSPLARPKEPAPPPPVEEVAEAAEKTDEQLKAELETELNKRFKLLRMALSSSDDYPSFAFLTGGETHLRWVEGMYLKEEYENSASPVLNALACDLRVLTIKDEGVLVEAASFEKPDKVFEVLIPMNYEPVNLNYDRWSFSPERDAFRRVGEDSFEHEPRERYRERYKEDGWGYPFPEDDRQKIDDIAKYVRPTDKGLQILPNLPKDSPARKHGARGGEIIKSINGVSVKSLSDVRRVVRTQYNEGTREFTVAYERDGIPGTKTFGDPAGKSDD